MNIWLVMLATGLITYATRLSFIWLFEKWDLPVPMRRALRFVPAAVLSAIIFPELLLHSGQLDLSFGNTRLLAGMLAAFVAWRTKNVLWTIGIGLAALLLLQWVTG